MKRTEEEAFGIIPLRQKDGGWQVLLIKHQAGHWAFPKGRPEKGETNRTTAERELTEETGLAIDIFLDQEPLAEKYIFQRDGELVYKTVTYFPATVKGEVVLQEEELADFAWTSVAEAKARATFPEAKNLCIELEKLLAPSQS